MKVLRCTVSSLLLTIGSVLAQDGIKTEAVQLTVRHQPTIEGVQVFGEPGIEVQVAVQVPGKPLLTVDKKACKLVRWVDDKGTDLAAGAPTGFFHWVKLGASFNKEPSDSVMLDIKTATLPAGTAGRIELDAVVALISASGTREQTANVDLKKGTKIAGLVIPIEVSGVRDAGGGMQVEIQSDQSFDGIREITFLDEKGQSLDAQSMGSSSFGFGNKITYSRSYQLPAKRQSVSIKVSAYEKTETIEVPIKLALGVGLR